eukprot:c17950_g1_i1.p1 GENE.c17950_g1_i1~~c17950_g1_i1.p1  ORF type:complete len:243 (-),score=53.79 c17950_g1_i1:229-957(-)
MQQRKKSSIFAPNKHLVKVVLIGDGGVGKTCILTRFCDNWFPEFAAAPTIGVDFRDRPLKVDGKECRIQVWDTAGQEKFRSIARNYLRRTHVVLMVFDFSDTKSFHGIKDWMTDILDYATSPPEWRGESPLICLVGNKADRSDIKIDTKSARNYADSQKIPFFETSAKTGQGILPMFEEIARLVFVRQKEVLDNVSVLPTINFNFASIGNDISVKVTKIVEETDAKAKGCCGSDRVKNQTQL